MVYTPPQIAITGVGLLSSLGLDLASHTWPFQQPPTPKPLQHAVDAGLPTQLAFAIDRLKPHAYMKRRKDLKLMSRDAWIALVAAAHALEHAGLHPHDRASWPTNPREIGLFMGVGLEVGETRDLVRALSVSSPDPTNPSIDLKLLAEQGLDLIPPLSALKTLPNMALAHVAINLDIMGPGESFTPHSTSGLHAVDAAMESIVLGECPLALAGAADSDLALELLLMSIKQGLVMETSAEDAESLQLPAPREGSIVGEGGAFLVLESEEHAQARGAVIHGHLLACGNYAAPTPDPTHHVQATASRAMRDLLSATPPDADLLIACQNAHSINGRRRDIEALLAQPSKRTGKTDIVWPSTHFGYTSSATAMMNLATLLTSSSHTHIASFASSPAGGFAWALASRTSSSTPTSASTP